MTQRWTPIVGLVAMAAVWTAAMLDRSGLHAAAAAAPIASQSPLLPEGYGKATVERLCLGCHEADRMVYLRETEEGWTAIVNSMRARGATGTEDEFHEVIAYLAWFFGPEPPPSATPAAEEPTRPGAGPATAAASYANVELVSEMTKVAPGEGVALGLRFTLDEGWHLSGQHGDDSAPRVSWTTPAGLSVGEIKWPAATAGNVAASSAGTDDVVLLIVPATLAASVAAGSTLDLRAEVTYQVCSTVCRNETASPSLQLRVGPGGTAARSAEFDRARAGVSPSK